MLGLPRSSITRSSPQATAGRRAKYRRRESGFPHDHQKPEPAPTIIGSQRDQHQRLPFARFRPRRLRIVSFSSRWTRKSFLLFTRVSLAPEQHIAASRSEAAAFTPQAFTTYTNVDCA